MWFHRKPSNRRMDRAEVLDVRLRTRSLRAARWRLAGLLVTLLIATIVGSYACVRAVGWLRREVIYDNQAFALNTIDVHTDGLIPAELVRQWT